MTKFIKLYGSLTILFILLISSCKKSDDNSSAIYPKFIKAVDSPDTGKINEPIVITVEYVNKGCGEFNGFNQIKNSNKIYIEAEAVHESGICNKPTTIETAYYTFTPPNKGNYSLNFKSSTTEFITVEVNVD